MPRHDGSFWHTLGRVVEVTASSLSGASGGRPSGRFGGKRKKTKKKKGARFQVSPVYPVSGVVAGAATAIVASLASQWARGRRPSMARLARGAMAGAGAAGLVFALRSLLDADATEPVEGAPEMADELLAGAGRGVVYAALLDPYLPGPPLVRGVLAGTADYIAAPIGGVFSRLQPLSPIRKLPLVSILLETGDADADPYPLFLLYGAALGLLHGSGPRRS